MAKKGHSYQLDLPALIGIYKVFYTSLLCKAANNPLPGQKVTPLLPINITREDE
jgi:hypothetical protein